MSQKPITAVDIRANKQRGSGAASGRLTKKLVMLTAYDATFASIFDRAGVDILLVGDSLGMVVQGHQNTLPVTLDQMVYHTAAVARATKVAHVVGDLPFMSYQVSVEQAVESAGRLVQQGSAHAVKLEGGAEIADAAIAIARAGIPVMGHIGLTPQSVHRMGGFKVQGRDSETARRLMEDARALDDAGCYSVVLEGIPAKLAEEITAAVSIPTIGIGAGSGCDGQVLVCYDALGMNPDFMPKFVKVYDNLFERITGAVRSFANEVRDGSFPTDAHSFHARPSRLADDSPDARDSKDGDGRGPLSGDAALSDSFRERPLAPSPNVPL